MQSLNNLESFLLFKLNFVIPGSKMYQTLNSVLTNECRVIIRKARVRNAGIKTKNEKNIFSAISSQQIFVKSSESK